MNKKNVITYLVLIFCVGIAFRLVDLQNRGVYLPDEARYYKYAAKGCDVLRAEGVVAALKFSANTFTAKPGHTIMGILWMSLLGVSQYHALLMNVFFAVSTLGLLYIIVHMFYTKSAALIAALSLAVSSLNIYYSRSFMSHIDQVFFIMLAFYFYVLPLSIRRYVFIWRFLSGLFLGIAFTVHPATTIYFIAFLVYELILFFIDHSRRLISKIAAFFTFFIGSGIAPLFFLVVDKGYFGKLLWLINEAQSVIIQRESAPVSFILSRVLVAYEGGVFAILALIAALYFLYRIFKYRRAVDLLIFMQSGGIFVYWEFFAAHEKLLRQISPAIPFFAIIIGVFVASLNFKKRQAAGAVKSVLVAAILISGSYSAGKLLLGTKNYYNRLEFFLKGQTGIPRLLTNSEYFMGTHDVLLKNLKINLTWFNEKEKIFNAIRNKEFDFFILYPGEWLYNNDFHFAVKPALIINEPQSAYFADFYEALCFNNRLGLLKYRNDSRSYSITVYKIDDALIKEVSERSAAK